MPVKLLEPIEISTYKQNKLNAITNSASNVLEMIPRLVKFLEKDSYDTNSLLSNLNAIRNTVMSNINITDEDRFIIMAALSFAIANGKLKNILQHLRSTKLYDMLYGTVFGLSCISYLSPFLSGTTQIGSYVTGGLFLAIKGIVASTNTQNTFYKILGVESDAMKCALKLVEPPILSLG